MKARGIRKISAIVLTLTMLVTFMPAMALTAQAESGENTVTVSFDANGGTAASPDSVSEAPGSVITLPEYAGTKDGYKFTGWTTAENQIGLHTYKLQDGSNYTSTYHPVYAAGSSYTVPSENVRLYAAWSFTNPITSDFYIRLDGTIPYEPSDYPNAQYTGRISIKDNIDKKQWICDSDATKSISGNGDGNYVENNVTANLKKMPTNEQLAAVINAKSGTTGFTVKVEKNELVVDEIKDSNAAGARGKKAGDQLYVLWYVQKLQDVNWNNYRNPLAGTWHIDGSLLVKEQVNVSYNGNAPAGAGMVSNVPLGYQDAKGTEIKVGASGSNNGTVAAPTLAGYTFAGWNTEADGTGTDYAAGSTYTLNENTTFYAQWTPDKRTYTLKYDANEGTGAPADQTDSNENGQADFEVSSTVPVREGFTFQGWADTADATEAKADYAAGKTITVSDPATKTIYAVWQEIEQPQPPEEKYTVTYTDGVDGEEVFKDQITTDILSGAKTPEFNGTPTRDGYKFTGWTPDVKDTVTESVTYTAQWEKESTPVTPDPVVPTPVTYYTLTYDTNGGQPSYKNETYSRGTDAGDKIREKTPEKEGFSFVGWYEDKELTNPVEKTEKIRMNSNRTVYAKWEENKLNKQDHHGYIVGYPDGTIQPNGNITRAETATIFFRLLTENARRDMWDTSNNFSDVQSVHWHNNAVSTMSSGGIVRGYGDSTFKPDSPITRAEFAAIAARFDPSDPAALSALTDISGHWAEDYIVKAEALGYIKGYEDGSFRPDQYITRAEAVTLINRVLDRDKVTVEGLLHDDMIKWSDNMDQSAWYYTAMQEATNSHYYDADKGCVAWTEMRDMRDWAALEKEDSTAESSKSEGDVSVVRSSAKH